MRAVLLLVLASACIDSAGSTCPGSDKVCRGGTVCLQLAVDDEICVRPDQFAPCDGVADAQACVLPVDGPGTCYGGACLPVVCGDKHVDVLEACDDGDNQPGDGCSGDCLSDETCGNGIVDPVELVATISIPREQCDDKNLVGHDGCSSDCISETVRWELVSADGPNERAQPALAYDARRRRMVMFGGWQLSISPGNPPIQSYGDTWESDGETWTQVVVPFSPQARGAHAMAYDPVKQRIVMFGGQSGNLLDDTWVLDGNQWTQLTPMVKPSPRAHHAMAYHPGLGVVLFGGADLNGALDDTWVWNGTSWSVLSLPTRPPARSRHTMAYDPVRNVIVMTAGTPSSDTWELDVSGWVPVAPTNARPRSAESTMGYDPVGRQMILFGGDEGGVYVDTTWSWNGAAWTQLFPQGPIPFHRSAAGVSYNPKTGELAIFGGHTRAPGCAVCDLQPLQDTWRWTGTQWQIDGLSVVAPAISQHAATLDLDRGRVVIFGGTTGTTYEHDGRHWFKGGRNSTGPVGRSGSAMAYDAARARAVMFGGTNGSDDFSDTWTYDGAWRPEPVSGPSQRSGHAMGYDARRERVVLFGGGDVDDTWEWDGASWRAVVPASQSPGIRSGAQLAYDPIRGQLLLFGGRLANGLETSDLWTWDGLDWTPIATPISPPARSSSGFAWDPTRRRMVLFGGGSPVGNDTWEWDGAAWTFVSFVTSPVLPSPREGHVLVTSPTGAGVLLMGGSRYSIRNDELWLLRRESEAPYETCRGSFDEDRDALAGCSDADCWLSCTPHCTPGATCDPLAPRCGDLVCDEPRESCGLCADCACVVRCGDFVCSASETAATCPGDCP